MTMMRAARATAIAFVLIFAASTVAPVSADTLANKTGWTTPVMPAASTVADEGDDCDDGALFEPLDPAVLASMFPYTVAEPAVAPPPMPQAGLGGVQQRVRVRSTPAPDRDDLTLFGILREDPRESHLNATFGGINNAGGLSLGIDLTTANSIPGVELYADLSVSFFRFYRRFDTGAIFGDLDESGWKGLARFRYTRRRSDRFFGVGPTSTQDPVLDPAFSPFPYGGQTNIDREDREIQGSLWYKTARLQTGIFAELGSNSVYEGKDENDPSVFDLYQPYFSGLDCLSPVFPRNAVPGLLGGRVFGYGGFFEYDARNRYYGLPQGAYIYAKIASYDGLNDDADAIGFPGDPYDFGWIEGTIDARGYVPLGGPRTSLALRLFTELTDRKGASAIPYYRLPVLGGSTTLRGFQTFRFRGENSLVVQAELRRTIWEKEGQGIDLAFFGDGGQIWGYGYNRDCVTDVLGFDPKVGDGFEKENWEADLGIGAAYRLSSSFGFRLDYAHSNEGNRIRLVFSSGF
jgi:outer membrane protein assembly factor BamA